MLRREFVFTADASGRTDFQIVYQVWRNRDPAKIEKGERRYLAEIQRALDPVSIPIGDLPEDADIDLRPRKLDPLVVGQRVSISQKAWEKVDGWIDDTPFQAALSVAIEDFRDRWSAAEKLEVEAPKPEIALVKSESDGA